MAQRTAEEVLRNLCFRKPICYFGDDENDEELDLLEEQKKSDTEEDAYSL